jgi:L-lactate dehydrogenase (cytochrome)/(S)-mandelate dehydrogenase
VDVPVGSNREGLRRNGFMGKMPWRIKFEALKHPGWMMEYLTYGEPKLANYLQYAGGDQKKALGIIMPPAYTWEAVQRLRDLWKGQLLIKGILSPKGAAKAVELGADGIYVSNHGGRQLNRSPAPFEMLPIIRKAVGDRATLVIDSGVRRGSDVILARAMGASLALMGRVPNYGAAAGGLRGVSHSLEIIRREADMVLGQMGCTSVKDLGPHMLFDSQRGEFCG